jgi:hypothetical protein
MVLFTNSTVSCGVVFRGATAFFTTTFYDANNNVTQPAGAVLTLAFIDAVTGNEDTASITMTAPTFPAVTWTAEWDSRGAAPPTVWGSIHTTGSLIPYAVEDFQFTLSANTANLATF